MMAAMHVERFPMNGSNTSSPRLDDISISWASKSIGFWVGWVREVSQERLTCNTHLLHHVGGSCSFPAGCNFENGLVYRFNQTYSHKNVCDTLGPWRASPSVRGWLCPLRNESNFKNCVIVK